MKSAFDMALYDLLALRANMPLYQLLGGNNKREIFTDMTISIGDPEKVAGVAMAAITIAVRSVTIVLQNKLPRYEAPEAQFDGGAISQAVAAVAG